MVDFTNVVAKVALGQNKLMATAAEKAEAQKAARVEAQKPRWKFVKTIAPFGGVVIAGKEITWHRPIRQRTRTPAPFGEWSTTSLEEAKEMRNIIAASSTYIFEQTAPEVLEHEKQLEQAALSAQQENKNERHEEGQAGVQQQVGHECRDGIQEPAPGSPGEGHQSHQPGEHPQVSTELV